MKRFIRDIKIQDLTFFSGTQEDLDTYVPDIKLPQGNKESDQLHINILIDERLKSEINDFCKVQIKSILEKSAVSEIKTFQETTKTRFTRFIQKYPEWFPLLAVEYLILFRESIYKHNIELHKTKKDLSPLERKSLRFQIGLSVSRMFDSMFTYQLPYFIQDLNFRDYTKLFNPVFLSASFPEYFMSDYFCYLDIKSPLWNQERLNIYHQLLRDSSTYGVKSLIGVSISSRGVALQKTFRLIKSKFPNFTEETAPEIIEKIQDDPSILKELLKQREFRKQILTEDAKKTSKQDYFDRLLEEFTICSNRFPLSKFFALATDAEILRKIANNIILKDPRDHLQGFGDLLQEYTLFMVKSPFIYDPTELPRAQQPSGIKQSVVAPEQQATETTMPDFDQEETILVDVDLRKMREKLDASFAKETPETEDAATDITLDEIGRVPAEHIPESSVPAEKQEEQSSASFQGVTSLSDIETAIDEIRDIMGQEDTEQKMPPESVSTETPTEANVGPQPVITPAHRTPPLPGLESPYLFGVFKVSAENELLLAEEIDGYNYRLVSSTPQNATFKIILGADKIRFLAKKESNWHKPSQIRQTAPGRYEASITRRSDSRIFTFCFVDQSRTTQNDSELEPLGEMIIDPFQTTTEVPDEETEMFRSMSIAELSQSLLDGLIDIDRYNDIIAARNTTPSSNQITEEPDFVLEQGTTFCNDWQGRILNCSQDEADMTITLSGQHFDLALKVGTTWKNIFSNQSVPQIGFKGTFTKTIRFQDPSSESNDEISVQRIEKEYSFTIFHLVGRDYGIKFS